MVMIFLSTTYELLTKHIDARIIKIWIVFFIIFLMKFYENNAMLTLKYTLIRIDKIKSDK